MIILAILHHLKLWFYFSSSLHAYNFILNRDNTCEINVMDLFDRKDVKADQFEKGSIVDLDTVAGKYATKSRKSTVKLFTKSATHWILLASDVLRIIFNVRISINLHKISGLFLSMIFPINSFL